MERITKAVAERPATVEEISKLLYGDAAYEVVKALTAEQKKKRDKAMQNVAIGTNMVGAVAGPAALGLAYRSARKNEGGTPRAYASNVARAMQGKNKPRPVRIAGLKVQQAKNTLNRPMSGKAKVASAAAAGTLVGLQAVNWGGDVLSAKLLKDQKKKDEKVGKSLKETATEPRGLRMIRLTSGPAFEAARKAPVVAPKVKAKALQAGERVASESQRVRKSADMDITWAGEISKMDTDKRQVFGWASVIEVDGKPVLDLQEDVLDLETIEKAAYDYVISSRKGGHQHARNGDDPKHVSDLVESFVITPEKKEKMGLPDSVPTGWWVGFKVNDEEVWGEVKKGKLKDFSIHGSGVRKEIEVDD